MKTYDIVSSSTFQYPAGQNILVGFSMPVNVIMFSTPAAFFSVRYSLRPAPSGADPATDDPGTGYFVVATSGAPYVLTLPEGHEVVGINIRAQNLTTEQLSVTGALVH